MVFKNEKTGKWEVRTYYKDYTGARKQKTKRGFGTKRDALDWERAFKLQREHSTDMFFGDFFEIYKRDKKPRIKNSTWRTKEYIVKDKILPYFEKRKLSEIKPADVIEWQNEIMGENTKDGKPYSSGYLKTIHNQLSAIFNHAVELYNLKDNPARKAGNMGKESKQEMLFWTQDEYQKFIEQVADKEVSYIAFELLYWCGIREGELLALRKMDFDFNKNTVWIRRTLDRNKGVDSFTDPKTEKSNRKIMMPDFLAEEVKEYIRRCYKIPEDERLFQVSKGYLHHEMDRGANAAGVKRIRIHDLRHSHVSLLINMGFDAVAIADRTGHEAIAITYRYAHMFPSVQKDMADKLNDERRMLENVRKTTGPEGKMEN